MTHHNREDSTSRKKTSKPSERSPVSRRRFIKTAGAGLAGLALTPRWAHARGPLRIGQRLVRQRKPEKLIYIALDALHPAYLGLNSRGDGPGQRGDWLMPHLKAFLYSSVWYPNAKDYLPAATDSNHLNALAGTSSGQTGIISVSTQLMGWNWRGKPETEDICLDWARDDQGRTVDTLFHAWKRRNPDATTAFITGKGWVGKMFTNTGVVDLIVHGEEGEYPDYVPAPYSHSICDPPSDPDARCDPESLYQRGNPLTLGMRAKPDSFPPDSWVVDAALSVFQNESPDMAYILLAQPDDSGHAIGAAWDTDLRMPGDVYQRPQLFCPDDPLYQIVSTTNPRLFVEPILDAIRDTDAEFGRLIDGLRRQGALDNATVMIVSDHSMVTYLRGQGMQHQRELQAATDYYKLLLDAGLGTERTITPFSACSFALVYWRRGKETVRAAKELLESHLALNPETGEWECPWFVIDRDEMIHGKEDVCLPGELYHKWFVETDAEQTMVWPDLILLARNRWELPVYGTGLGNLGISVPDWMFLGPLYLFTGGHGSTDTQPIVMGISRPGGATGALDRDVRIGDLAVTAKDLFGLELQSTTIGESLVDDL